MGRAARALARFALAAAAAAALSLCVAAPDPVAEVGLPEQPEDAPAAAQGAPVQDPPAAQDPLAQEEAEPRALQMLRDAADVFSGRVEVPETAYLTVGDLLDAYGAFQLEPEHDYVSGIEYSFRENALEERDCALVSFELRYLIEDRDRPTYALELRQAVDEVLADVAAARPADDGERVLAAYDSILSRCTGVSGSTSQLFTAYGCLVGREAVGKGFADALYLVLKELGIPCVVVSQGEGGTHWNMVQVGGSWYHANLYWDSRSTDDGDHTRLFCLCGDAAMRQVDSRGWTAPHEVPVGYFEGLAGQGRDAHVAFAKTLWHRMVDPGLPSLRHLEVYRITYDEAMDAFAAEFSGPRWGYVLSHGAEYITPSSFTEGKRLVTSLNAEYRLTGGEIAALPATLQAGLGEVLAQVDGSADVYWQVAAVHDWLVRNLSYDLEGAPASHTAFGAFAYRTAVCEGYSCAFQLAMDELGIPCATVRSAEMDHQWNMVAIDGRWYHVDVTWDDPAPDRGPEAEVSHEHFLRGDDAMRWMGYSGWDAPAPAPGDFWG